MTRCLNCGRSVENGDGCPCHDPTEAQPTFEEFVDQVASGAHRVHHVERGQTPTRNWRIMNRPEWWVTCHLIGGGVFEYLATGSDAAAQMMGAVLRAQAAAA